MSRSAPLPVNRIAAGLIGAALLGAMAIVFWPDTNTPNSGLPKAGPASPKAGTLPASPDPSLYPIRSSLTVDHKMKHGEWIWNEAAAPIGGPDGNVMLITVDLKAQMMSVFRGGHEIGVAVIEHGATGKPTPLGDASGEQRARGLGLVAQPQLWRCRDVATTDPNKGTSPCR